MRRRRPGLLAAGLVVLLAGAATWARAADSQRYAGRSLVEALDLLRGQGLRLIYSSDLVRPEMRVEREPTATTLHRILDQLLAPHGLTSQMGPGGNLLVVKREPGQLLVTLTAPETGGMAAGEVAVSVDVVGEEPVAEVDLLVNGRLAARLQRPPWRARIELPAEEGSWRLTAVARGAWGGFGSDSVTTRSVVVREELEVSLRQLAVTATRRGGGPTRLSQEHFRLLQGGSTIPIASFERGDVPLSVVLAIDASESMRDGALEAALGAVRGFLAQLQPGDEAALLLFSDAVRVLTPFAGSGHDLPADVAGARPHGSTALNDHVYAALRLLDGRTGRPVVLLLSDGADVVSALGMEQVLWKIGRSEAHVYWVRLPGGPAGGASFSSAWRDAEGNRRQTELLSAGVQASGGRILPVAGSERVVAAFATILEELREQYLLGYYPRRDAGGIDAREVEVQVTVPNMRLRYRRLGGIGRGSG
ncbi:MAG TPA: VWA domain-containing protein [Thermoanaerobaculia bacterium]|nr:VWA domain-containing protein [Thermoanaerobaculia bacterium]